ncbi:hypothetical protein GOP47_0014174, partial [Adiantum capillus-veneris]
CVCVCERERERERECYARSYGGNHNSEGDSEESQRLGDGHCLPHYRLRHDRLRLAWQVHCCLVAHRYTKKRLTGHGHFVQDVVISSDGQFALFGSWDGELRLWDLNAGVTTRRFVGHTKDVLSVAFSVDNRQIVSAARDRSIKLWNTLGECKYTIQDGDAHTGWVSCVRVFPVTTNPIIVSGSWDRSVKVWNLTNCKLRTNLSGHTGYVNSVTVSPDGKRRKRWCCYALGFGRG